MKKTVARVVSLSLIVGASITLRAGGVLETFDITAGTPSPIAGHLLARVIGIRWDDRAIPVKYRVNNAADPVPNPLPPNTPVLTIAQATAALQQSFDAWNSLPTSYIDMRIVGTVTNPGLRGFDMINELTFNTSGTFAAIASSPSVSLIADVTFAAGDDIDGDGDSDVANGITVTTDVDNDGDLEFPPGFYRAGTILDNDVQFNTKASNGFRFTIGDAALDTTTRSVDLNTVATHEFGHSHGLSHAMVNQSSGSDGDGATMFPFIDTGDPLSELQQRSLHTDDIAWSSYLYPEGSKLSGPGALQGSDIAFSKIFGLITGEVSHGTLNGPIAGASVHAIEKAGDRLTATGFSGTTQMSFDPVSGGLFILPDPADGVLDGRYVIPVPKGSYAVGVEAVDGGPVPAASIGLTVQIGAAYGQQNFNEEFYDKNKEGDEEMRPGQAKNVHVNPGKIKDGIDIVTNDAFNINNFGPLNAIGFANSPPGRYYAVQIPAAQIAAINPGEPLLAHSVLFETFLVDASTVPVFAEAMLTTGVVNADGTATVDLAKPLDRDKLFVGQDGDFSPLFLKSPRPLGDFIRHGIERGTIANLFLVLRIPTAAPFPGVSGQPPFIGLNTAAPILGRSFVSDDGLTFDPILTANFRFSLVLASPPHSPH